MSATRSFFRAIWLVIAASIVADVPKAHPIGCEDEPVLD
jgi:hypothetical protein